MTEFTTRKSDELPLSLRTFLIAVGSEVGANGESAVVELHIKENLVRRSVPARRSQLRSLMMTKS
jgi:hypothetical protein